MCYKPVYMTKTKFQFNRSFLFALPILFFAEVGFTQYSTIPPAALKDDCDPKVYQAYLDFRKIVGNHQMSLSMRATKFLDTESADSITQKATTGSAYYKQWDWMSMNGLAKLCEWNAEFQKELVRLEAK